MGSSLSYYWDSNEPDPVTGLTPREIYLVKTSFSEFQKHTLKAGTDIFMTLFDHDPNHQKYFSFNDIPLEELPLAPKFRAHAVQVMYSLGSIVENLDNSEALFNTLRKVGATHADLGIPERPFHIFRGIILAVLEKTLGPKISKECLDAWNKTLLMGFKIVIDSNKVNSKISIDM